MRKNKKGFSLIELLIAVAVLGIVSAFMLSSYTGVLEEKRKETDMRTLNEIDQSLQQIYLYRDAFAEAEANVINDNKIVIKFPLSVENKTSYVKLEEAKVNNTDEYLKNKLPITYDYLINYLGDQLELTSASYIHGYYEVVVEFNMTKVSDVRLPALSNDTIIITNTGDTELKQLPN